MAVPLSYMYIYYLCKLMMSNWTLALRQTLVKRSAAPSGMSGMSTLSVMEPLSLEHLDMVSSSVSGLYVTQPSSRSTTVSPPTYNHTYYYKAYTPFKILLQVIHTF